MKCTHFRDLRNFKKIKQLLRKNEYHIIYNINSIMGGGMSSEKFRHQENYVMKNIEKEKKRMSHYKNCNGKNRYNDEQIKMKLRQEYNNKGHFKNCINKDDFICHAHWNYNKNY